MKKQLFIGAFQSFKLCGLAELLESGEQFEIKIAGEKDMRSSAFILQF